MLAQDEKNPACGFFVLFSSFLFPSRFITFYSAFESPISPVLVVWAQPRAEPSRRLANGLAGNLNDHCLLWACCIVEKLRPYFSIRLWPFFLRGNGLGKTFARWAVAWRDWASPRARPSFERLSCFRKPRASSADEPTTLCSGDVAAAISRGLSLWRRQAFTRTLGSWFLKLPVFKNTISIHFRSFYLGLLQER